MYQRRIQQALLNWSHHRPVSITPIRRPYCFGVIWCYHWYQVDIHAESTVLIQQRFSRPCCSVVRLELLEIGENFNKLLPTKSSSRFGGILRLVRRFLIYHRFLINEPSFLAELLRTHLFLYLVFPLKWSWPMFVPSRLRPFGLIRSS